MSASATPMDVYDVVCGRDPLLRFVSRLTGRSLLQAVFLIVAIQIVLKFIPAVLFSFHHDDGLADGSLFHHREFAMCIIWEIANAASVCVACVWQPAGIQTLFATLQANGVVPTLTEEGDCRRFLRAHISKPLDSPWTIGIVLLWTTTSITLSSIATWHGSSMSSTWWSVDPWYYWGVYTVVNALFGYFIFWGLVRQFVLIRALRKLFNKRPINPQIMHPDGCMGFAPIATYASLISIPVVFWGLCWGTGLLLPRHGSEPTAVATLLGLAVYPLFVAFFIILPVLTPHGRLKAARTKALEEVAVAIRNHLRSPDVDTPEGVESLRRFEHKYAFIQEHYSAWPFDSRAIRRFCLVAIVPMLMPLVQMLLEHLPKG